VQHRGAPLSCRCARQTRGCLQTSSVDLEHLMCARTSRGVRRHRQCAPTRRHMPRGCAHRGPRARRPGTTACRARAASAALGGASGG
jgi:hypothetical protein